MTCLIVGPKWEIIVSIADFKGTSPEFLPEEFFNGRLEGWAVIESLVGGLQRRSTILAEGRWDAASQRISFTETYRFDDGHQDTLSWTIRKLKRGKFRD